MSEVSIQANAIVLAASTRMVALCTKASQNLVNGIESKKQFKQAHKILTLLKAYTHSADMNAYEADALLYCLKNLSDANSFPTTNPIVGQSLTVQILIAGGNIIFYNQGIFLGIASQVDFEIITAALNGNRLTVTMPDGVIINIGDWDASADTFPNSGGTGPSGAIKKGNEVNIIVAGAPGGYPIEIGAIMRAKIDNPGQVLTNWRIFD